MNGLPIFNMTSFFTREMYLYSLGDISLAKPVSLKKVGFFLFGLLIWSVPLVLVFGFYFNVFYLFLLLIVPILLGVWGDKPVFDGRTVFGAAQVSIKYMFSNKCFTDFTASDTHREPSYYIEQEIWISRRRELQELAELWEERTA